MKIKSALKLTVISAMILSSVPLFPNKSQAESDVSVKLSNYLGNRTTITLDIKGSYYFAGNPSVKLSGSYTLSKEGGSLRLKGSNINELLAGNFTLVPEEYGVQNTISVNSRIYLGEMKFTLEGGVIRPVNSLPLEDYLKGVVPNEMPSSWHVEALKAQAVAARTYAMTYTGNTITDTQTHQVYGGYNSAPNSLRAVEETRGEVLKHNGKLISAVYTSSNGGKIESNNGAWNSPTLPYLKAKNDPFDPQNPFNYYISESALASGFQSSSRVAIKNINSIRVTEFTEGGYAKTIKFSINNNSSSFNITGSKLRAVLGASSIKSTYLQEVVKSGSSFVFKGKGFGHGVGMSQYGAKIMAEKNYTYKEILGFYYAGADLSGSSLPGVNEPEYVEKPTAPILDLSKIKVHTVVPGDTLYAISKKYNVTVEQIMKWNKMNSASLYAGDMLYVSDPAEAEVVKEEEENEKPPVKEEVVPPIVEDEKEVEPAIEEEIKPEPPIKEDIVEEPVIVPEVKPEVKPITKTVTKTHIVKRGDTLWSLSRLNNVSVPNLKLWNKLPNNTLKIGQNIIVSKTEVIVNAKEMGIEEEEVKATKPSTIPPSSNKYTEKQVNVGTSSYLNVRQLPSSNSKSLGRLYKDNIVKVEYFSGMWAKVNYNNQDGYVHADFLKDYEKPSIVNDVYDKSNLVFYTVRKGDTLFSIASSKGVYVDNIKSWNGLTTDLIYVGQKLRYKQY